jgi:hypothetical protein
MDDPVEGLGGERAEQRLELLVENSTGRVPPSIWSSSGSVAMRPSGHGIGV